MSRFIIGALCADHHGATEQLAAALPLAGETVEILSDTAGAGPWFYAILDEPLKYRTPSGEWQDDTGLYTLITDVVFRSHNPGQQPAFGMRAFPVDLAVVLDPHMAERAVVDLSCIDFIAVVEIDDAENEPPDAPDADSASVGTEAAPSDDEFIAGDTDPSPPPVEVAPTGLVDTAQSPAGDFAGDMEFVEYDAADQPQSLEAEWITRHADFEDASASDEAMAPWESAAENTTERPLLLPAPTPPPPAPAAARRALPAPPPPAQAAQVQDLIAQAEATVARPQRPPASQPRPAGRSAITVEPARPRDKGRLVAAAVAAGLLTLGGWGFWALQSRQSDTEPAEPPTDAPTTTMASPSSQTPAPRPEDIAKVTRVLPPGYPPGACLAAETTEAGGIATLTCGRNDDQGGPLTGLYTVFPDRALLNEAFDRAVAASEQLICPGNIQSPGPWHRMQTPQKNTGIVFCGTRDQKPTIIWSDTERMLLSTVQSTVDGTTLDALYGWWTQHS